jgi:UDP-N-acetylmuramate dehydrogenase
MPSARRVSEKPRIFINPGAAKAADIEALIVHVRAVVRARTGVDLEPEVRIVGEAASAAGVGVPQ